ncbi:MAG: J domain-containing protein, partial [Rhodospirillales bacterium]|nr:J domain-containing protein [Rhodospirillales bacterium]
MAEDPYKVLGLEKTASEDDIRRTFRKLAKELHPDMNPDKSAAERFRQVSDAYEIVGTPEKRKKYDRGEIDIDGNPMGFGFGGGMGGGPLGGSGGGSQRQPADRSRHGARRACCHARKAAAVQRCMSM